MKYNATIQNMGALPLPYSIVTGQHDVSVGSLYKDKPLFVQLNYITGTNDGRCFRLNITKDGKNATLILPVDPDLNIKPCEDQSNAKSIPTTPSDAQKV